MFVSTTSGLIVRRGNQGDDGGNHGYTRIKRFANCACALPVSADAGSHGRELVDRTFRAPTDFEVIELRRYTIKDGARKNFAGYFEAYFPEAIEQTAQSLPARSSSATIQTGLLGFEDFTPWKPAPSPTRRSITDRCGESTGKR
jgi:hypothetical protein